MDIQLSGDIKLSDSSDAELLGELFKRKRYTPCNVMLHIGEFAVEIHITSGDVLELQKVLKENAENGKSKKM